MLNNQETTYTNSRQVACQGEDSQNGHPKIYLTFKTDEAELNCPYCNKLFKYNKND